MYRWAKFLPLFALAAVPHVHASALLDSALQPWLQERDAWAFTQHVREFDKEGVKAERVERYDPSLPEMTRWTLLELNGHAPTLAEASAFTQKKGRKRKEPRPLTDYIDFDRVTVQAATPQWVRYEVPLREINRLIPVDKITLAVTVDRNSRAIEQITAILREPLRIAFGVARVSDMNFDLHFNAPGQLAPVEPAAAQPSGVAQATLFKFGNRAEFEWSDFKRVTPHPTTRGSSVAVDR